MICPPGRAPALDQLACFVPFAPIYPRDRNHVKPGHPSVSRLSPAIRHRVIGEDEVASAVLQAHSFSRVEKFIQEIYWRRYWKSWLSLRPGVWENHLEALENRPASDLSRKIEAAESGNAVIDYFSQELVTTGYLHNHARMWFAAWWVHEAKLPWQSGAAFFLKHLLDGDPASNTLSWRWVAGLQTPGKTYLARRSNLEKYLAPELLDPLSKGLAAFENPEPHLPEFLEKPLITRSDLARFDFDDSLATGLWIHEEDLSPETSPLAHLSIRAIIVAGHPEAWNRHGYATRKREWLADALADASARATSHWEIETPVMVPDDLAASLVSWAKSGAVEQIAALRPEVGPLNDSLPEISLALASAGIRLALIDRPRDLEFRSLATGGFFQFWEKIRSRGLGGDSGFPPG